MKRGKTSFLKVVIVIIGILVISLCIFYLPILTRVAIVRFPEFSHLGLPVLLGLYITAIPFYNALYHAFSLLLYIDQNNAFSHSSIIALKEIKHSAITIVVLYMISMFVLIFVNALHPGIALLGLTIIFASLIIAFFAAILQELLRSALQIKSENDLTV